MSFQRRLLLTRAAALAAAWTPLPGMSQAFPNRPLRIIVPYTAGGSVDAYVRRVATGLSASLGQTVIVDNRPGADNAIAMGLLTKAAPDGHTIAVVGSSLVVNPILQKNVQFAPADLAPITRLAIAPQFLAVSSTLQVQTMQEFISAAKSASAPISCGSASSGLRAIGGVLQEVGGIKLIDVPYKGEAPIMNDLLAGHVQCAFMSGGSVAAHYNFNQRAQAKVRPLAVVANERSRAFPEVPTFKELGMPDVSDLSLWNGFFAPLGTPQAIVEKMAAEIAKVVASAEVRSYMEGQAFVTPSTNLPSEFAHALKADMERWQGIARRFKLEPI